MTRKHFEALAAALRSNAPSPDGSSYGVEADLFEHIVNSVADACERTNPRFDYERFARASGLAAIRDQRGLPFNEINSSTTCVERAA